MYSQLFVSHGVPQVRFQQFHSAKRAFGGARRYWQSRISAARYERFPTALAQHPEHEVATGVFSPETFEGKCVSIVRTRFECLLQTLD